MVKENVVVKKKPGARRGRKPKGGKIISNQKLSINKEKFTLPNVILHLKCVSSEQPSLINKIIKEGDVISHNCNKKVFGNVGVFNSASNNKQQGIWEKINQLKKNLHANDISGKRSDCFFCNESFDNHPIHLPKEERNGTMEV